MERSSAAADPGGGRRRRGNLAVRLASAALLGPAVLAVLWLGGPLFVVVVLVAALICVHEWIGLLAPAGRGLALELSFGFMMAATVVAVLVGPLPAVLVVGGLTIVLYAVMRATHETRRLMLALGNPYIAATVIALVWLRDQPEVGRAMTLWLVLVVWATDSAAYAAGRAIGGPRLAPRISPNKTWAGLAGAVAGAAASGALAGWVFGAARPEIAAGVAGVVALAAQGGDLLESAVKRRSGQKDSGSLIPGHGGMLDRIDGIIGAAPLFALYHAGLGRAVGWW
ncbi:MAG: phosphatidate cytidylyltransferase [Azospirillaceae bacterium]